MDKNTFYRCIYILMILVLIFELYKCTAREYFSTSPTDYTLMKDDAETKFISEDEEIQVGEQAVRGARKWFFDRIKAVNNIYIAAYAKKGDEVVRYFIVSVKETDLLPIFGVNGLFVNEDKYEIKYFIKILTKPSYEKGMILQNKLMDEKNKYSICLTKNSLIMPKVTAVDLCKKEINVVPT